MSLSIKTLTVVRGTLSMQKDQDVRLALGPLAEMSDRLSESQASEQTVMAIAGHVSRKMMERYSHIRTNAKRTAVEALNLPGFESPVHQNVHQVSKSKKPAAVKLLN